LDEAVARETSIGRPA